MSFLPVFHVMPSVRPCPSCRIPRALSSCTSIRAGWGKTSRSAKLLCVYCFHCGNCRIRVKTGPRPMPVIVIFIPSPIVPLS